MKIFKIINQSIQSFFALWVIAISILAYFYPMIFLGVKPYITLLLGIIMFGMGMTLNIEDFKIAFTKPLPIFIGVLLQFLVMPAIGFFLSLILKLPPEIAVGVVLVGSCPGGTASNVIVFLSRGNTALSIAMTTISTLLAPILTPLLMLIYANRWLPVDHGSLFLSIVKIVLLPVILGIVVKRFFPNTIDKAKIYAPSISVIAIVAIIGCVVALNRENLKSTAVLIFIAVILHNMLGVLIGFFLAKFSKQDEKNCRTIAVEVGMQNSGLGAALAYAHFSPVTALPSAIFSVWHNISGSILASIWNRKN